MVNLRLFLGVVGAISVLLSSCGSESKGPTALPAPPTAGLFPPVDLGPDSTYLHIHDFFPTEGMPDSVATPEGLSYALDPQSNGLYLTRDKNPLAPLSTLGLYYDGHRFDVLLRRSRLVNVKFSFAPQGKAPGKVQVAGEMNGWNPATGNMTLVNGVWETSFPLNPGAYQYQIVQDGAWGLDPANTKVVSNGIGGFNSEVTVGSKEALETPLPILATYDHSDSVIRVMVGSTRPFDAQDLFVFFENQRIELAGTDLTDGGTLAKIKVPASARTMERSHLRVWYRTEDGWSNDLLIPLKNGKVFMDTRALGAQDQHKNILYFLMVDRFNNGDKSNDKPVPDPEVHPKANYHGGDLAGVIQKVEAGYFDSLGVNMIWLSPIVQNPDSAFREWPAPNRKYSGYHGYWPVATNKVDYRFGTAATLDSLVGSIHRKGHKVILDYVANHLHENHPLVKSNPTWFTPLKINDSTLNVRQWDSHRLTTWFDTFLPSLDHAQPQVVEWQVDTAVWWLQRFHLDGFRHDATKHIEEVFWRRLTERIRTDYLLKEHKPVFQIGETFGSRALIGSYVGAGLLDAQFDFNHYFDIRGAFAQDGQSIEEQILASFKESEAYYGSHSLMGNITGNHDMARFISLAGGALRFNEDPKAAGWDRDIQVGSPLAYARLRMLIAYLSSIPGLPVIYYGDEIGMPGADDPDNRRDMKFGGLLPEEQKTKALCGALLKLRGTHMAALYGETSMKVQGRVLTVHRHYFEEDLYYLFNLDAIPATVKTPAYQVKPLINGTPVTGEMVTLPAWGFEVFTR